MRKEQVVLHNDPGWVELQRRLREAQNRQDALRYRLAETGREFDAELDRLAQEIISGGPMNTGRVAELWAQKQVLERACTLAERAVHTLKMRTSGGPPVTYERVREKSDPPWLDTDR